MHLEQNENLKGYFESNSEINDEIHKFLEGQIYSLNAGQASMYYLRDFALNFKETYQIEFDRYNFWYFYLYLISSFKDGYLNDLNLIDVNTSLKSSITENYDCINESIIKFIGNFEIYLTNNSKYKTESINSLISNYKYIPLLCIKFLCKKSHGTFSNLSNYKIWLKHEYSEFYKNFMIYNSKNHNNNHYDAILIVPNKFEKMLDDSLIS